MTPAIQKTKEVEEEQRANHLVLVVTNYTLDKLYPPFIIATTAAASGMSVDLYFTFWGLKVMDKRSKNIKMAPVGNPALPMPNIMGMLPGMTAMATNMMKGKIKKYWPTIAEMMQEAKDMGVKFHACSPTMGLMGMKPEDLSPLADDVCGASAFLEWATSPRTVTLFI